MPSIGIVGAGVSGLHLALYLRQHDVDVTLYSERSADEIATGRLMNTVAHHRATLDREAALGIDHWDIATHGYAGHTHWFGLPEPLTFRGEFAAPSRAIDYRVYLPQLMADADERGVVLKIGPVDVAAAGAAHDLVVIAAGRGSELSELFPPRPERSRTEPWRKLTAGLFRGIAKAEPNDVTLSVVPGSGEIIEIPILSFDGWVTALLIEAAPGSDHEAVCAISHADDPSGFRKQVLELLAQHAPLTYARVDPEAFDVTRPLDVLQGAVTPTLRHGWTRLAGGTFAVALGDAHCLVDPVVAQGANSASWSAFTLGEEIVAASAFDADFCTRVEARRLGYLESAYDWVDTMLGPPSPQLLALTIGMAMNPEVCNEFTDNFSFPDKQWASLESLQATRDHLAKYGLDADAILTSLPPPPA